MSSSGSRQKQQDTGIELEDKIRYVKRSSTQRGRTWASPQVPETGEGLLTVY